MTERSVMHPNFQLLMRALFAPSSNCCGAAGQWWLVKIKAGSKMDFFCHCIRWYFWLLWLHSIQHSSYKKLVVHCKLLTLWDKDWVSSSPAWIELNIHPLLYALGTWVFCFFHSTKIVLTVPSVVKNQYIKGSFVSFIQKKTVSAGWVFDFVNGEQVWGFYTFRK
jgi:hypothetical protein